MWMKILWYQCKDIKVPESKAKWQMEKWRGRVGGGGGVAITYEGVSSKPEISKCIGVQVESPYVYMECF